MAWPHGVRSRDRRFDRPRDAPEPTGRRALRQAACSPTRGLSPGNSQVCARSRGQRFSQDPAQEHGKLALVGDWRLSLARVLADDDEENSRQRGGSSPAPAPLALWSWWTLGLLLIALLPRLIYLFAISNPENAGDGLYTDVYQHWQIAYLTKEIGLSHGLRLWDLKGVEYFWGSLHPIVLVILFFVTGSTDIVLARVQSLAFGSLGVVLIFHRTHGSQPVTPRHLAAVQTLPLGRNRLGACHRGPTRGLAVFTRTCPRVVSAAGDPAPMVPVASRVYERHGRPSGISHCPDRQPHLSAVLELPGQCQRPVDEAAGRQPAIGQAVVCSPLGISNGRLAYDALAPAAIVFALALWIRVMCAGLRSVRPDGIYHRVVPLALDDVDPRLPVRLCRLARCDWLVRNRASLCWKGNSAAHLGDCRGPAGRRAAALDPPPGGVHEHSRGLEHRRRHGSLHCWHLRSG